MVVQLHALIQSKAIGIVPIKWAKIYLGSLISNLMHIGKPLLSMIDARRRRPHYGTVSLLNPGISTRDWDHKAYTLGLSGSWEHKDEMRQETSL